MPWGEVVAISIIWICVTLVFFHDAIGGFIFALIAGGATGAICNARS